MTPAWLDHLTVAGAACREVSCNLAQRPVSSIAFVLVDSRPRFVMYQGNGAVDVHTYPLRRVARDMVSCLASIAYGALTLVSMGLEAAVCLWPSVP
jgi:hypothetical protein